MWLCGYVAMRLCGSVAMWLYDYVAMWRGYGYVVMWLCAYVAIQLYGCGYMASYHRICANLVIGGRLSMSWSQLIRNLGLKPHESACLLIYN